MIESITLTMTPEQRTQLEDKVDRHVRRGELSEAWAVLSRLSDAFPADGALRARLKQFEDSLEPAEWRRVTGFKSEPSGSYKTPMHHAEALAAQGRFSEAMEIYRAMLDEHPSHELARERLAELYQLARVAEPARPAVDRTGVLEHLLERIASRRRQ